MPTQKPITSLTVLSLLGVNLIYACTSLATKYASRQEPLSWGFICGIGAAVLILGVYAVLWQQILKRIELSSAYMFKGSSLIFVLILSAVFYGEGITLWNIVGALTIAGGIVLFARS